MTCNGLGQVSNFSTLYGYPEVGGWRNNSSCQYSSHGSQEKDGGQKPYFIKKELTRDVSGLTKSHLINLVDLTYKGKVESEMLLWTTGSQNMHISYYIALI